MTLEMQKRIANIHKQNVAKAMQHLGKAAECRDAGMASLEKVAAHFVEAKKSGRTELPTDEIASHLVKANGHFQQMEDHQELAAHHINKVASAWGVGTLPSDTGGSIRTSRQEELTEGEVPEYEVDKPYEGKAAIPQGFVTAGEAAAREKAAKLEGENAGLKALTDAYSRMPVGGPRARVFAVDKTAFAGAGDGSGSAGDPMSILMKGVQFDQNDPDSINRAAGTMIGNMIGDTLGGGRTFGRSPIGDPSFRGQAAGRKH